MYVQSEKYSFENMYEKIYKSANYKVFLKIEQIQYPCIHFVLGV
jgi:hypothetical protein